MATLKKHTFTRPNADSLVVIPCQIDNDPLALALDTGASQTTIDLNPLLMAGYEIKNALRTVPLETASGIIEASIFVIKSLTILGITKRNIEVCAYDFFAYHLLTDFDGVIGLDFFEDVKFCVDMKNSIISIEK
jgi:predicted aspartyl protease